MYVQPTVQLVIKLCLRSTCLLVVIGLFHLVSLVPNLSSCFLCILGARIPVYMTAWRTYWCLNMWCRPRRFFTGMIVQGVHACRLRLELTINRRKIKHKNRIASIRGHNKQQTLKINQQSGLQILHPSPRAQTENFLGNDCLRLYALAKYSYCVATCSDVCARTTPAYS